MIDKSISYSFCDPSPVLIADSVSAPSKVVQVSSIYEGDLKEDIIVFTPPDVETKISIVNTPKQLDTISNLSNIASETNGELDMDNYPDDEIFQNHKDFLCHLSYSFELSAQVNIIIYSLSIAEELPVFLPPPQPPPLTFVSLTTITTKWGESYQEWG